MRKMRFTSLILILFAALPVVAGGPSWLEADSAAAVRNRLRADFPYTFGEFVRDASARYPQYADPELVKRAVKDKYIETMMIDDTLRVFRKAVRNLGLLDPRLNGGWTSRNFDVTPQRIAYVDSVLAHHDGLNPLGAAHRVTYRFTIDVPYHEAVAGDTLDVWMPIPFESARQSNVRILSATQPDYTLSGDRSVHNTIHFRGPAAAAPGDTARFGYTAVYDTRGQYFSPEYIRANMRPYDKNSELYRRYTAVEAPHIVRMDSLARAIAGDATDPYEMSERVFAYIDSTFPWAGAREYSTIPCIPEYVVAERHGDCGQVSLLYISLMRSLGVPARWESGWMLHPGERNYHDWAEVYFEGVGWVPVDPSFGRYVGASDPRARDFYSTGMDSYRFATNRGVCGEFVPSKRYVRSETVDHQPGEVECSRGNLYWPAWDQNMTILSITPIPAEP